MRSQDRRVVHQHIESARLGADAFDQRCGGARYGGVVGDAPSPTARLGDARSHGVCVVLATSGHETLGPGFGKLRCDRGANSTGATRDQGQLVREIEGLVDLHR